MLKIFFTFLLSMFVSMPAFAADFSDVSPTHVHQEAIAYVRAEGIVKGYEDGTFKPGRAINRAEFTKIIVAAQFSDAEIEACADSSFSDVPKGEWFTSYICLAKKKEIIQGYSDDTFRPVQTISFAEAAKIIIKAFGFSVAEDSVWYRPFVQRLEEEKAIPDSIHQFTQAINRGEMAEMIWRLKAKVKNKPTKTYLDLSGEKKPDKKPSENEVSIEVKAEIQFEGKVLAGIKSPFLDFNSPDYEKALKSGKPIMLYFYASWCPLCQDEVANATVPAFNEWDSSDMIGFRVNFKDSDTDEQERELARKFGVAYQHTKVILNAEGERILKSPESWNKERYREEFKKLK